MHRCCEHWRFTACNTFQEFTGLVINSDGPSDILVTNSNLHFYFIINKEKHFIPHDKWSLGCLRIKQEKTLRVHILLLEITGVLWTAPFFLYKVSMIRHCALQILTTTESKHTERAISEPSSVSWHSKEEKQHMAQRFFSPQTHSKFSQSQDKMPFPNGESEWWQFQAPSNILLILPFRSHSDPVMVSAATFLSLTWAVLCQDIGIWWSNCSRRHGCRRGECVLSPSLHRCWWHLGHGADFWGVSESPAPGVEDSHGWGYSAWL